MSNIQSINHHEEYVHNSQKTVEQERKRAQQAENKDNHVQDVLDNALKNTIKRENIAASSQDVSSAEEASSLLADVLNKISTSPTADKIHTLFDTSRINALING